MLGNAYCRSVDSSVFMRIAALLLLLASSPAWAAHYLDVVISELMYHSPGTDEQGEYLELTNRGTQTVNLSGWRLNDGVRYSFPAGTTLGAGQRLVVAHDPAAVQALYGISGVLGPYDGRLANDGERIELLDANDGLVCEVDYDDESPWPTGGDGDGRSIELIDLNKNHNVGRFWKPSSRILGTPGSANSPGERPVTVVINEFLANSSTKDWIELYNYGDTPVDLNNYYLTDNPKYPTKARISASWSAGTTIIPAKGYWTSDEDDWATFKLSSSGEQVYLIAPDGVTWVDGYDFGTQPLTDATEGRYPDGDESWKKLTTTTRGTANVPPAVPNVVINEIMYHPAGDTLNDPATEYIELYNAGSSPVDLTGWSLNRAVDYDFPAGTTIPVGGYLVIAYDPARVQTMYGISEVLGPYEKRLSNFSDEIELEDALGNRVDFVEYRQEGLWPTEPDGTGPSLELANYSMDNRLPGAWRASSGIGTPGSVNSQYVANPAASIDRVTHKPLVPTSSQPVTVTALVGAGSLSSVRLYYKDDDVGSFSNTLMYDDGAHGDGLAGDGVYGGTIPAYPNNTIVEFYIQADATGGNRTFPDGAAANKSCLYIVQNNPTSPMAESNLTIFRFVLTDENWNLLQSNPNSDDPKDCTFIFGDKAYYNAGVRFRSGIRDWAKHSYKVYMPPGYHFRGADRFNLNWEKFDTTCLKNKIINRFMERMGVPYCQTEYIHTRWRDEYAGVHLYTEVQRDEWLAKHWPGDSDGNMYKASTCCCSSLWKQDPHGWYEKETNETTTDWSDFDDLTNAFSSQCYARSQNCYTLCQEPPAGWEDQMLARLDANNWGWNMAVWCTILAIDTPWHFHGWNYRIYRRFSDGRWSLLPYDWDDAWWDTMFEASIYSSLFGQWNQLMHLGSFDRPYKQRLWHAVNSTNGVIREAMIESELYYYHGLIYNDAAADPWISYPDRWNGTKGFANGVNWLNNVAIPARNASIRGQLPSAVLAITTNGGNPITTSNPNLTLEGTAPLSAARLEIDGSEEGIRWLSATQWRRELVLVYHDNNIVVRALDDEGYVLGEVSIEVTYTHGIQDEVDFSTGPLPTVPPYLVLFHDESNAENITAWEWDFGDGSPHSFEQHPAHTYAQWGTYSVSLTIQADGGPYTRLKNIQVGTPIAVDFDRDGDRDQSDFGFIQACLAGAGVGITNPDCRACDLDSQDDCDYEDVVTFLGCLSGPGVPANPQCP